MSEEMTVVAAPATHSQPWRKSKRAWRKNIDLDTLQTGLEDLQDAKILHGNLLPSEQESSQLFITDTAGDDDLAKKHAGNRKPLKAAEILARRSKIPALDGRKRKAEDKPVGRVKRIKNGTYVPHKQLQHLKDVADGKSTAVTSDESATHDPWAETPTIVDTNMTFIAQAQAKAKREPKTLKQAPKTLTANGKSIPHVRIPDAGKSYNPLVGDWSALLEREGAAAVEKEQQRLAAEAAEEEREARAAEEAARVEAAEKDMYATDYDSAWESEWDGFVSGAEGDEVHTQKQVGRKTQAQRNKIKARKEEEAKLRHEKNVKAREQQERRIEQIAKEVSAKDKARRAHQRSLQLAESSDSDAGDEVQLRRLRKGKLSVPEAPLEVVLPDELEDSLRRLKPEGDLIQERYRNLLINGKIEVRKKVGQRKQPKTTRSEKWSYKDWKLR